MALWFPLLSIPRGRNAPATRTDITNTPPHTLSVPWLYLGMQALISSSLTWKANLLPLPVFPALLSIWIHSLSIRVTRAVSRRRITNPLHKGITVFLLSLLMPPQTSLPSHCSISCGHPWSLTNMPKSAHTPTPSSSLMSSQISVEIVSSLSGQVLALVPILLL